jgi:hypothetical protein
LTRIFTISNDPHFAEKLQDAVGLYRNTPERPKETSPTEM